MRDGRRDREGVQGAGGVRRYHHNPDRLELNDMKTVKPRVPGRLPPAGPRSAQGLTAIAVPTASRTVRVEPLLRRSPARPERQLRG
jgi:hypothetical protein